MALENSGNGCKCPLRPLGVEADSLLYCMVHWWVLVNLSLLAWSLQVVYHVLWNMLAPGHVSS